MDLIKKALDYMRKKLGRNASNLSFLALHIVQKIQNDMPGATSKEKRDAAIKELMDAATAAGMEAGEHLVRFLIEGAVSVVKSKIAPAAPAAPKAPAPAAAPAQPVAK